MNHDTVSSPYIANLKAEHRELWQIVHRIRDCLADTAELPPQRAQAMQEALRLLLGHLERHFSQEEEGGYLEEALAYAPQFGPQASRLLRQHPELLAQCRELLEDCRACRDGKAWSDLQAATERTLNELVIHEARENRIVEHAFNTDLGLND